MVERRVNLLLAVGQREPGLHSVELGPGRALSAGERSEWTMPLPAVIRLTAPGSITLREPSAVAMVDRAVEQISDGREVDVRVRADVHALAGRQGVPARTRRRR